MDAKELRIGNAVFVGGKIKWVNHRLISDLASDPKQLGRVRGYEITPIPLTEEWLVRMGFEKEDLGDDSPYVWFVNKNVPGFKVWDYNNEHWIFEPADQAAINCDHFKFVHQLQNLYFALTGKELEIKQL